MNENFKLKEILNQISGAFAQKELSKEELSQIGNFCAALAHDDIQFESSKAGIQMFLNNEIPAQVGRDAIAAFDQNAGLSQYATNQEVTKAELQQFIGQPLNVYFNTDQAGKLNFLLGRPSASFGNSSAKDAFDRFSQAQGSAYGSPLKFEIPAHVVDAAFAFLDQSDTATAELYTAVCPSSEVTKHGRVSVILVCSAGASSRYYDTFDPCPPGKC